MILGTRFFPELQLLLLAPACLLVAVKFNECEQKVFDTLKVIRDAGFDMESVVDMEKYVLKALNWRISAETPLSFIGFLLSCCTEFETNETCEGILLSPSGCDDDDNSSCVEHGEEYLRQLAQHAYGFADFVVDHYELRQHAPLVLAASSVYCARKALHFMPEWPQRLVELSGLPEADLRPCTDRMWKLKETLYAAEVRGRDSPADVRRAASLFSEE